MSPWFPQCDGMLPVRLPIGFEHKASDTFGHGMERKQ